LLLGVFQIAGDVAGAEQNEGGEGGQNSHGEQSGGPHVTPQAVRCRCPRNE
jgi:hypothetical protein